MTGSISALRATGPNAGFMDFGQGSFQGRPIAVPVLGQRPIKGFHKTILTMILSVTSMYMYIHTYMPNSLPKPSLPQPASFTPMALNCSVKDLLRLFCRFGPDSRTFWKSRPSKRPYTRIFCPLVTLWSMVLQRLLADHTLDNVQAHVTSGQCDGLIRGRKLSRLVKSQNTASLSDARQRLPLEFIRCVFLRMKALLGLASTWKGFHLCVLDGAYIRLRPFQQISQFYKPHHTQNGKSYWRQMPVVVSFCLYTGLALQSQEGPFSEVVLGSQLILGALPNSLFIADRGFGVFRLFQVARQTNIQLVTRMTRPRAGRVVKNIHAGMDCIVLWAPSRRDQIDESCSKEPIQVRFICAVVKRDGFRPITLYLMTTLLDQALYSVEDLLELYGYRWHVELNLRYLKAQMDLSDLTCKSPEMAQKEWYAGLIAYNLVRSTMALAAQKVRIQPLQLSFSSSARRIIDALIEGAGTQKLDWDRLLNRVSQCRIPNRKKPRPNEPRLVRMVPKKFGALRGSRQAARQKLQKTNLNS
jgi:hypothetical protein